MVPLFRRGIDGRFDPCLDPARGPWPAPQRAQALPAALATDSVAAGFPSPADDYIETGIDLNDALIRHPSSTFFLRVSGDSMRGAGIQHGDLLIVDRSLELRSGKIVVAVIEGAFTLKRLVQHQGQWHLEAAHPAYPATPSTTTWTIASGGRELRHPCPLGTRRPAHPAAGPPC